ncbi:MAG: helix-turn-helix domain-containing protein [Reyranella sp.]|nr:helix-turn-helix domain-containing protein [Reyranella sp.]
MTTLGERVREERRAKGWSQAELARRVSNAGYQMTQGGIAQIERRGETEPKSIVQLAQALGVSVHWLQSSRGDKTAGIAAGDSEQLSILPAGRSGRGAGASSAAPGGRQRLQVFASAQGGKEGAIVLSNEPVSWLPRDPRLEGVTDAYGCFVSGESMEPAYEKGNILLVNPSVQPEPGDDVVFMREDKDGQRYVLIKRLVKVNAQNWTVKQYNPGRTFTLSRKEWAKAHLVIGKYNTAG